MNKTLILALIFSFLLVILAIQNADVIDIDLYFWTLEGSLAVVLVATFGLGTLTGLLFSIPGNLRKKKEIRDLKRNLQATKTKTPPVSNGPIES